MQLKDLLGLTSSKQRMLTQICGRVNLIIPSTSPTMLQHPPLTGIKVLEFAGLAPGEYTKDK